MSKAARRAIDYCFTFDADDPVLRMVDSLFDQLPAADELATVETIRVETIEDRVAIRAGTDVIDCAIEDAERKLVSLVNLRAAMERSADLPVLHAGGLVTSPEGAVLIAGRSGSGKSTLVAAALERDLGDYMADELIAVRGDGSVAEGYGKALTLKAGSWPALTTLPPVMPIEVQRFAGDVRYVAASVFGAKTVLTSRIQRVVFPTYSPEEGAVRELEPLEAVERLCESAYQPLSASAFCALSRLAFSASAATVQFASTKTGLRVLDGAARHAPEPTIGHRPEVETEGEIAWIAADGQAMIFRSSNGHLIRVADDAGDVASTLDGPDCWTFLAALGLG